MAEKNIEDMSVKELTERLTAINQERDQIIKVIQDAARAIGVPTAGPVPTPTTKKTSAPAATAPEPDKSAILKVMTEAAKPYKSGQVSKDAKLKAPEGKAAIAALVADGKIVRSGPWIKLA
jgi:hypothetical protein